MMKLTNLALLTAGGALFLGYLLASSTSPISPSKFAPTQTEDARFGQYHHVYAVRNKGGKLVPWFSTLKDGGAITDLDGNSVEPSPVAEYPGCASVEVDFDKSHEQGFKWINHTDGDAAVVSSRSQNVQLLACRDAVPAFEAILAIS
jgi:hypothetical protein